MPDDIVAVSLRAPTAVGERWAWVDFNRGEGLSELNAAADAVLAWLDELDVPRVGLVGWSQGGAMAVHLIRRRPDRFAAAAVFGGFVWVRRPHAGFRRARPPILYAMGDRDDVIPPRWVEASDRWLGEHARLERRTYPGIDHMLTARTAREAVDFVVPHLRGTNREVTR
jgi:phospholipase/carboxylesterase